MSEEEEDQALLAWFQLGRRSDSDQDHALGLNGFLLDVAACPATDLDTELRSFGLSPNERRKFLRPIRSSPPDRNRHKATLLKQFRWWIDQRVDWSKTDLHPDQVVGTWASLTKHDVDLAKSWWEAGIDPLDLEQITDLSKLGLHPRDLVVTIGGRRILEHLRRGSSVKWCVNALNWNRRDNCGA